MLCSGCGKDIPFNGSVCPHCHRNKAGDQQTQITGVFFGFLGAAIGYFVFDGILAGFVGLIAGSFIGGIVGATSNTRRSSPPDVHVVNNSETQGSNQERPQQPQTTQVEAAASRLESLTSLKTKGLITETEFNAKRQKILEEL